MRITKTNLAMLASAAMLAFPLTAASAQAVPGTTAVKHAPNETVMTSLHNSADESADAVSDSVEGAREATAEAIAETDADAGAEVGANATTATPASAVVAATAADVTQGATVRDTQGGLVGTIEKVDANGAVIATGAARVQIPVNSFAKNDQGLIISLTKTQLEAQAKAAAS